MRYFFDVYLTFQGKMNRLQFMGALIFYIFLCLIMIGIGYILFEVIDSLFMTSVERSVDFAFDSKGNAIGTMIVQEFHSSFPTDVMSLTLAQKFLFLMLTFILEITFVYPLSCLCAKRFHDIGFYTYIPLVTMMSFDLIERTFYIFANYNSNISVLIYTIIISICLFVPSKLNHRYITT